MVIAAGENGVLESVDDGDDTTAVITGFSTAATFGPGTTISIVAGPNGVAETRRGENTDDLQQESFGMTGLAGDTATILPGNNGFIDTAAVGDDVYVGLGIPCDEDSDCRPGDVWGGGACDGQEIL